MQDSSSKPLASSNNLEHEITMSLSFDWFWNGFVTYKLDIILKEMNCSKVIIIKFKFLLTIIFGSILVILDNRSNETDL